MTCRIYTDREVRALRAFKNVERLSRLLLVSVCERRHVIDPEGCAATIARVCKYDVATARVQMWQLGWASREWAITGWLADEKLDGAHTRP